MGGDDEYGPSLFNKSIKRAELIVCKRQTYFRARLR